MAHARERGLVWSSKSVLQLLCIFWLLRVSNLSKNQTKAVFDLKLMVGWGEHKVVLDKSWFRVYYIEVIWGLNCLSVALPWRGTAAVQNPAEARDDLGPLRIILLRTSQRLRRVGVIYWQRRDVHPPHCCGERLSGGGKEALTHAPSNCVPRLSNLSDN